MAGNLYIAALLAKEVDFIANVGTPFRAAVTGLPIKVLAVSMSKPLFYILAQPNIRSPKELIGKKFALSSSQGTSARAAKAGLRSLGLDPNKDLTFIVIGLASIRMAAMEAGSVEATVLSSPSNIRMRQKGFKELIFAGKDLSEPVMGIATSNEKIEKDPNQVKKVLKALMRSMWVIKQDQQEVTNFMARRFNLEPEVAREAYETMMLSITESGTLNPKDARNYLEEVKKETGIKKDLLVDDLLDFRLLREVTRELRR
jgi:ABC-type nitrate/sulfonate/bicarbonate transport system substrate-binding protein